MRGVNILCKQASQSRTFSDDVSMKYGMSGKKQNPISFRKLVGRISISGTRLTNLRQKRLSELSGIMRRIGTPMLSYKRYGHQNVQICQRPLPIFMASIFIAVKFRSLAAFYVSRKVLRERELRYWLKHPMYSGYCTCASKGPMRLLETSSHFPQHFCQDRVVKNRFGCMAWF